MKLRSAQWLEGNDEVAMLHRVALRIRPEDYGKPIVAIADTSSDLNPCNIGFEKLVEEVSAGITEAGGIPVRFPVISLGEDLMKPSAMLYRNLMAMELEENIRSYPIDGLVFLANCDKTVPASLMAAASTNIPSLLLLGGARSAPLFMGKPLGAGTDLWRALEDRRAGDISDSQWADLERCLNCTGPGACNTMGTASSMAVITESLGMALPGTACLAAVGTPIEQAARATGARVTTMVLDDIRPRTILTQDAFDNAGRVLAAVGGSTNAVIHLAAVAGRLGVDASLERLNRLWEDIPLLVDVEPCGSGLVHQFNESGGLPALLRTMEHLAALDTPCADGRPWRDVVAELQSPGGPDGIVRPLDNPVMPAPTMAAVFGSLAPRGAVIKVAAATPDLLVHTGTAVVFRSYDDMRTRLDDPDLEVDADAVLVVRGCGPIGVPGMPEWGMAPIPQRLVEKGVRDMVRISDGRMSGTSFGTVLLHVAPEAAAAGPLALVEDGDQLRLDVPQRRVDILVDEAELDRRRSVLEPYSSPHLRGWPRLYQDHVLQADEGADLDFLAAPTEQSREFIEPVIGRS